MMANNTNEPPAIALVVQVHPHSRRARLSFSGDVLHVWVTAPPVEGAANDAVIALIATTLGIPRRQVQIVRGATARHKRVSITGIASADLRAKIAKAE
jgi:uncharacterized protein (TIGR00251 family)